MNMHTQENLTNEGAAEYYWEIFMRPLQNQY
jgi:hypothetical protein